MSCNYCWNQPKIYERYDLYLDGKIKADDFVYRTKDESGEIIPIKISEKFEELENRLETHFTFDNTYQSYGELQEAFTHRKLKESVIYIVIDDEPSDDPYMRDRYNEYMIMGGKLELIGSGSYAKQTADLYTVTGYTTFNTFDNKKTDGEDINSRINKEIVDRIADVNAEEKRATDKENDIVKKLTTITGYDFSEDLTTEGGSIDTRIKNENKNRTDADTLIRETVTSITGYPFEKITGDTLSISGELKKRVPYSLHENVIVVGNTKDVVKLDVPDSTNEAMYCPQGLIMGGTAKDAGLVTRGICGVSAPNNDGSCEKENLYINYDGTDTYSSGRQLIIQAGTSGQSYGHNLYQFAAARGDAVKGYVDAQVKVEKERATGVENELKGRIDTLVGQNLNSRLASIEVLDLATVIATVSELQSKIGGLEATIEQLKNNNAIEESENGDVTEPTDPETPTE